MTWSWLIIKTDPLRWARSRKEFTRFVIHVSQFLVPVALFMIIPVLSRFFARTSAKLRQPALFLSLTLSLAVVGASQAQTDYAWETFAGIGGGSGDRDSLGAAARFSTPFGVVLDSQGNVLVADRANNTIRKIAPDGTVTTLAGLAQPASGGWADGVGGEARFRGPLGLAIDPNDNLYVADAENHVIRKVTPAGVVTTLAGVPGESGSTDGNASAAKFKSPSGVAVALNGDILIADTDNSTIRRVSNGVVDTVAGASGQPGLQDGQGTEARFTTPAFLAVSPTGRVAVSDRPNGVIREIIPNQQGFFTITKSGVSGLQANGLAYDGSGTLFVVDGTVIRAYYATGGGKVIVGTPVAGGSGFGSLQGLTVGPAGLLYVTDGSHTVHKVSPSGSMVTIAGTAIRFGAHNGPGYQAILHKPMLLTKDELGNVYMMDARGLRRIDRQGNVMMFGTNGPAVPGTAYISSDLGEVLKISNGVVTTYSIGFDSPQGTAVDAAGNVFVADSGNHVIRKIAPGGAKSIVAGVLDSPGDANGSLGTALFRTPNGVAVDADGNLYVTDEGHAIRKVAPDGEVSVFAGDQHIPGYEDGDRLSARFYEIAGIAIDAEGNLFVTDKRNRNVRKISTAGVVSTLTSTGGYKGSQGGINERAYFADPRGIVVDQAGNVFVGDYMSHSVVAGVPKRGVSVEVGGVALADDLSTYPWGFVERGATGTRTFTVRNDGSQPLTGLSLQLTGVEFSIQTNLGATTLAPGASTQFTLAFNPAQNPNHNGSFRLVSSDSLEGEFDVALVGWTGDITPPVITVPEDVVVEAMHHNQSQPVQFTTPTASDNVGVTYFDSTHESGQNFPPGETVVEVTARDAAGNESTAYFTVTVQDTVAPVITSAPGPQFVKADVTLNKGVLPDYRSMVTGVDLNEQMGPSFKTQTPAAGTLLDLGRHLVKVEVADPAGNVSFVEIPVSIVRKGLTLPGGISAISGSTVPATVGLDPATTVASFGVPALSDAGDLVAKATLKSGRTMLAAIYLEESDGSGEIVAYQGQDADGVTGATFKSFGDPVFAPDGTLAFAAKLQGAGAVTTSTDDSVWTDALGGGLRMVLREGTAILPDLKLKAASSISLRDGELLVLATLAPAKGFVTTADDVVVLRLTAGGAEILLREGEVLSAGEPAVGSKVKTISILGPALGSPGHGRWQADGSAVAKVTLADGRTAIVRLETGVDPAPILVTKDSAVDQGLSSKWSKFGLPAIGGSGTGYAVHGTLQALRGEVTTNDDTVLLYCYDGNHFTTVAQENDPDSHLPASVFASFLDPVVNAEEEVLFQATRRGTGVPANAKIGLWRGFPGDLTMVMTLGASANDATGQPLDSQRYAGILGYALPDQGGPVFLAKVAGTGVSATNNVGLWSQDGTGKIRRIVGLGDDLALTDGPNPPVRKIKTLSLLNSAAGVFGTTRSFNRTGSIAALVTFTDKTQALVRFDLP